MRVHIHIRAQHDPARNDAKTQQHSWHSGMAPNTMLYAANHWCKNRFYHRTLRCPERMSKMLQCAGHINHVGPMPRLQWRGASGAVKAYACSVSPHNGNQTFASTFTCDGSTCESRGIKECNSKNCLPRSPYKCQPYSIVLSSILCLAYGTSFCNTTSFFHSSS